MKAVWKGSISFGLVNIAIKLYSAIQKHTLGFQLLHAKCHTPIAYKRWCTKCKKEIAWSEVVKGMKLSDGSYFVITKENLHELKPEKTTDISIVEFVDKKTISPIYYDSHYYIAPDTITEKSYYLLTECLKNLDRIAIGTFVMKDKEHICAIQPYEGFLLLSTLNYAYEIRDARAVKELGVSVSAHISAAELRLAEQLIKKLTKKKFDISRFKDTYIEKLKERIKRKAKGKKLASQVVRQPLSRGQKKEESLAKLLEQSIKRKPATMRQPVAYAKSARKPAARKKRTGHVRKKIARPKR